MKIDSHQHFWKYNPVRDAWIDDSMHVIRRNFLPEDLEPIFKKNVVDGCVAIQADQSEEETKFLLKCAKQNSFIKGVVGWLDLKADNVEERLSFYSKNSIFKGVRHIVQAEADSFMLHEDFQNGISKLEQFNLIYDILIFPPQLDATITLVNKYPNQKFVVDHMAKPFIKEGKINQWKAKIIELAKAPNVYCKISGMTTEADWTTWITSDFNPYFDVIFKAFGTNRVLYGSDWPVCLLSSTYKEQLSVVENYIAKFSQKEKEAIMGRNAIEFYNLQV